MLAASNSATTLIVDSRDRIAFAAASLEGAIHRDDLTEAALERARTLVMIGRLPAAVMAAAPATLKLQLTGAPPDWRAAGLAVMPGGGHKGALPRLPFVVPRGLCEDAAPALKFDRQ